MDRNGVMEWDFVNTIMKLLSFVKRREFHDKCKDCKTVQGTANSHVVYSVVLSMDHADSYDFMYFVDARSKYELANLFIQQPGDNAATTQPVLSVTHSANLIDAAT